MVVDKLSDAETTIECRYVRVWPLYIDLFGLLVTYMNPLDPRPRVPRRTRGSLSKSHDWARPDGSSNQGVEICHIWLPRGD